MRTLVVFDDMAAAMSNAAPRRGGPAGVRAFGPNNPSLSASWKAFAPSG